jgi:hypothetical protein
MVNKNHQYQQNERKVWLQSIEHTGIKKILRHVTLEIQVLYLCNVAAGLAPIDLATHLTLLDVREHNIPCLLLFMEMKTS